MKRITIYNEEEFGLEIWVEANSRLEMLEEAKKEIAREILRIQNELR